jgi:hypothetical protein
MSLVFPPTFPPTFSTRAKSICLGVRRWVVAGGGDIISMVTVHLGASCGLEECAYWCWLGRMVLDPRQNQRRIQSGVGESVCCCHGALVS